MFDEGAGIALWIEDGTLCPLLTSSVVRACDSQETELVEKDVERICVRCHKALLPTSNWRPEPGKTLLFLRGVRPSKLAATEYGDVFQFEVTVGVEILPRSPPNRYAKALTQRLEKVSSESIVVCYYS